MLSEPLQRALDAALGLASARRHEYALLEHLLLALLDDADAAAALRVCRVDADRLRADLTEFIDRDLAGLMAERTGDPKPTAGFQRVVQRAALHVQAGGREEMTGADVLAALFSERESHAVYFLQLRDVTEDAVRAAARPPAERAPVFVALVAGPGMRAAWERGFLSGIRAAGHRAAADSPADLADGITGWVLGQVRRSRLVVVDHGRADGAVDFVAGFATGLGLPVVATCRADLADALRADVRRAGVLLWRTPEDLAAGLSERVVAVLGQGPGTMESEGEGRTAAPPPR